MIPVPVQGATGRTTTACIVFRPDLQLFVPSAPKDARLEPGANRGATDLSESWILEMQFLEMQFLEMQFLKMKA
jgi:hypothetical protein